MTRRCPGRAVARRPSPGPTGGARRWPRGRQGCLRLPRRHALEPIRSSQRSTVRSECPRPTIGRAARSTSRRAPRRTVGVLDQCRSRGSAQPPQGRVEGPQSFVGRSGPRGHPRWLARTPRTRRRRGPRGDTDVGAPAGPFFDRHDLRTQAVRRRRRSGLADQGPPIWSRPIDLPAPPAPPIGSVGPGGAEFFATDRGPGVAYAAWTGHRLPGEPPTTAARATSLEHRPTFRQDPAYRILTPSQTGGHPDRYAPACRRRSATGSRSGGTLVGPTPTATQSSSSRVGVTRATSGRPSCGIALVGAGSGCSSSIRATPACRARPTTTTSRPWPTT